MRSTTAILLALAALVLAGCRSDGGIGRRDALASMRWTLDTLEAQHDLDVAATSANAEALADWLVHDLSHPTEGMERTLQLYLEGHAER